MKKKFIFIFIIILFSNFLIAQLDPLQKYIKREGCPTLLKSCIIPPPLLSVGRIGAINNNSGTIMQFEKAGEAGETISETKVEPLNIPFSRIIDEKTQTITLESIAKTTIPGKIVIKLDNSNNLVTISTIMPNTTSALTVQLKFRLISDQSANFFTNFPRPGIISPDTESSDPDVNNSKSWYYINVIKNIKGNIRGICNLHAAQWTINFAINPGFTTTISSITFLFKYPVMWEPQEGFKPGCNIKSFNYTLTKEQLIAEGILTDPYDADITDTTTQKKNGDSGQSTTTTS